MIWNVMKIVRLFVLAVKLTTVFKIGRLYWLSYSRPIRRA
jgi:hypothetical protein